MKYSQFIKIEELNYYLLYLVGCLRIENIMIEIDTMPDYDVTEYSKSEMTTYALDKPYWDFSLSFTTLLNARIESTRVYAWSDIERLIEHTGIERIDNEGYGNYLNRVREYVDERTWEEFGNDPGFDGFRLTSLDIDSIDNTEKKIIFKGGFVGDSMSIQPLDWAVIADCNLIGIDANIESLKFYLELVSESYALLKEAKYKLAFFLSFVALESFINTNLPSDESKKTNERLNERLNKLFKITFSDISKHEIYNSVIGKLKTFEDIRNTIAHGSGDLILSADEAEDVLRFALIIICTIEKKVSTFKELNALLLPNL